MTEKSNSVRDAPNTLAEGAILDRNATGRMEMRVMAGGCTDADFRKLMDSHESLRNIVAWYVGKTQNGAT